jgi:hypothetical protein
MSAWSKIKWYLGGFLIGSIIIIGLPTRSLLQAFPSTSTKPAVLVLSPTSQSTDFLTNRAIPTEGLERNKVLNKIAESIPLDEFLIKWEISRQSLSVDQQVAFLNIILPRLLVCRPEIGIAGLNSIIGKIPRNLVKIAVRDVVGDAAWFSAVFSKIPSSGNKLDGASYVASLLFAAFGEKYDKEASEWLENHWDGGGRETLLSLLTGPCRAPNVSLFAKFLDLDPEMRSLLRSTGAGFTLNSLEDINNARELISSVKDSEAREILASKLGGGYSPLPEALWQGISELPEGKLRDIATKLYAEGLAKNQPDRAIDWVVEHQPSESTKSTVASILIQKGFVNATTIPQFISILQPLGSQSPGFIVHAVEDLVKSTEDPLVAVTFVASLPAGSAKSRAEENLTKSLPQRDPVAASIWINTLPAQSSIRDSAIVGLINSLNVDREASNNDREAALAWASSIHDHQIKQQTLTQLQE